jgi:hypothetical protein
MRNCEIAKLRNAEFRIPAFSHFAIPQQSPVFSRLFEFSFDLFAGVFRLAFAQTEILQRLT